MKISKLALITTAVLAFGFGAPAEEVAYPTKVAARPAPAFPYSMAGQMIFSSGLHDYQGSAAVVYKRSVLTAAHNLWDVRNGWSSNIEFNRARNGSDTPYQAFPRRVFVFGSYQANVRRYGSDSLRAFAFDLGGLRFPTSLADGGHAGWRADTRLLTNGAYNVALGYGAEYHSGDELLSVTPKYAYDQILGPFFENNSLTFEGGMSGGPVFADIGTGELRIVGVVVAGSDSPPVGGIRVLNSGAAQFLKTYLRY